MSHLTFAKPACGLPDRVIDFAVERARRGIAPLPSFRVGDRVLDLETGERGWVASILRRGHHHGQPRVIGVFVMGVRLVRPVNRVVHAGPPRRVPCA